jgi:mRNA interferase MazF
MGAPAYSQGEVLLALLVFSDAQGAKRRPVMVVRDFGDDDLLVVPVTSHPARTATDAGLKQWREAGLKLPSTVRAEKLATIEKSCVARKLGMLLPNDLAAVREKLISICKQITQ